MIDQEALIDEFVKLEAGAARMEMLIRKAAEEIADEHAGLEGSLVAMPIAARGINVTVRILPGMMNGPSTRILIERQIREQLGVSIP